MSLSPFFGKAGISYDSMKRNLLKIRNKILPKSPSNVPEIIASFQSDFVRENYGLTIRAEGSERTMFFKNAVECEEYSYYLFASDEIVDAVKKNIDVSRRQYIFDATFGVCPLGSFVQFLIISTNIMGQVSPLFVYFSIYLNLITLKFRTDGSDGFFFDEQ